MTPTRRLLHFTLAWCLLGAAASLFGGPWPAAWAVAGSLLAAIALADLLLLRLEKVPRARRRLPGRLALGVETEVILTLINPLRRRLQTEWIDGVPPAAEAPGQPAVVVLAPESETELAYPLRALERGTLALGRTWLRVRSRFGLWRRRHLAGENCEVRVFPNYEPIVRFSLLAMSHRESQMGIHLLNRRGGSREFHQLREYHDGDALSQVDWKASARRLQLISREYREQRHQTVVMAIDCGRRMRALDGELPQFDHCLNAALLLSFIALRQGDYAGVLGFGGDDPRWLPPVRGTQSMPVLLNHLHDYQAGLQPSDFLEAAERIQQFQRRRALVVLLTNLRSEDQSDLAAAVRLLARRHLVVVASLTEASAEALAWHPVGQFDQALAAAAAHRYLGERKAVLEHLSGCGALLVDQPAQRLPIALCNRYLDIKAGGRL